MGILSTYGELKTALTDYTARGGNSTIVANLPTFIRRAHDVLMRELEIPLLQTTTDLTIDAERVALPADFRAVSRLFIDGDWDSQLTPTSQELRVKTALTHPSGRPRVYSIEGGSFAFGPVPDTSYAGKLLYKRCLAFFANDAATNDLLTRYPNAYLYGALAELARFDKADEDEVRFEALFRAEIQQINAAEQAWTGAGGAMLMQPSGGVA